MQHEKVLPKEKLPEEKLHQEAPGDVIRLQTTRWAVIATKQVLRHWIGSAGMLRRRPARRPRRRLTPCASPTRLPRKRARLSQSNWIAFRLSVARPLRRIPLAPPVPRQLANRLAKALRPPTHPHPAQPQPA